MSKKALIISHIHVWDKQNKGDVAIVLAVQQLLRSRFSGVKIKDFPVESLKTFNRRRLDQINRSDLVVFGGGGLFYNYFLPFEQKMITAIKPPLVIFGVGYIQEIGAPELSPAKSKSLLNLIRKARLIGVRDFYTRNFLIKQGVKPAKIDLIGDPAILLSESKPAKLKLSAGMKIGLNLNYSGWLGFGLWRQDILKAYQDLAHYFIQQYRAQIYYLKHHPGEDNIYPELKIPGLKIIDLSPAEQKYAYGQLDLVVGMMLHASVLAFGAITPEINVAYDRRNYGFAKFIGCPELVIDLAKLKSGQLLKTAKQVFANHERYLVKFMRRRRLVRSYQSGFLDKIEKLFG